MPVVLLTVQPRVRVGEQWLLFVIPADVGAGMRARLELTGESDWLLGSGDDRVQERGEGRWATWKACEG